MSKITIISTLVLITNLLLAQENRKGDFIIGFSIGPGFANFINSEAPHKINIFGSDENPGLLSSSDVTTSLAYTNYQTSLFQDILIGVSAGIHAEYFIRKNFSIHSGIFYETKGINLNYSATRNGLSEIGIYPATHIVNGEISEVYKRKIINNYLIAPLLLRQYLLKKKEVFMEGGMYAGCLVSSKVTYRGEKTIISGAGDDRNVSQYAYWNDKKKDTEKEFTNEFDFGFSLGAGLVKNLSERLTFKTRALINIGLTKVDAKYHNEYEETLVPSGASLGSGVLLRSTNYYGLNSTAKNINLALTVGLGYRLGNKDKNDRF